MLNELKIKNPDIELFDINSEEFSTYGRTINGFDIDEIVAEAKKIENVGNGSNYKPSVVAFAQSLVPC